jgi:sugar O-acyltransferase (sialic acid O-acetyltransferase NeuD family)
VNIVVAGASGHAKVVLDVLEREGRFRVAGLIDGLRPANAECFGYRVLGSEADLPRIIEAHGVSGAIVAIGDNWVRSGMARRIEQAAPQLAFVTAVHPGAQVARGVCLGRGTVVMAGAVINSDTRIGEFSIVNTHASIDHDCVMEDFACVLPGAVLGGNVRLGAFAAVCLGAQVVHGVAIGEHTIVGAGALVLRDLPARVIAYGVPARVVRERVPGEPYL